MLLFVVIDMKKRKKSFQFLTGNIQNTLSYFSFTFLQ